MAQIDIALQKWTWAKMGKNMTRFALAAVLVLLSAAASHASGRLALVFGNGMYQSIGALENPTADANLMAEQLEASGFEVMLFTEATQLEMKRGIVQFGRRLRSMGSSATGLFYYAGHAVQVDGRNFLLPVESEIIDPADLDIVGVETQWVLQQMHSARNETNVVILDACRDNPFEGTVAGFNTTGLAEMNAPTGTFIS
ncbi:MAG: caspase family protein, partial [Pseudomonadota bacterium]